MDNAIDIYLQSLKAICPQLTNDELMLFASKLTIKELKKKELFLEAGKVQKSLGFIVTGLVRSYYIDQEGNEITVGFYPEGQYAKHYHAFIMRQYSRYFIQCLEPCSFVCIGFDDLQWIYQQSSQFERYGRLIAEEVIKAQQARIESFIFQTTEERYIQFTRENKSLFNRISVSHLCSYLGIERQSLTRIRQKLAHR